MVGAARHLRGMVRRVLRRPPQLGGADDRRRWFRGATSGAALALGVQLWMLTAGTWNLFRWDRTADFHDAQARAILHGTLSMDPRVLGIEAFRRGPNAYMYFGPVPAIQRLPVVAVTSRLDGRLGTVSMFAALVVIAVVVSRLGWRMRHAILGDASVSRAEAASAAIVVGVIVGGSSLLYASSRTWVYHETIMWGVAYTLASYSALMLWVRWRARRFVMWASVLATLAFLSRASVGGGAVAALAVVAGGATWSVVTNRAQRLNPAPHEGVSGRTVAVLWAAVALPVTSYAIVNFMKFRTLFSVPFEQQQFSLIDPQRQQMLAENGGSLFGWNFLPSNLVQYWRPDMINVSARFPFFDYPHRPMALIGSPTYDLQDATAGIPATMPVLVTLAVIGIVIVVRRRADVAGLTAVMAGCVAGTVTVLNIGYIANRYQSDFLPLLVIPALVGAPGVWGWWSRRRHDARSAVVARLGLAGLLTAALWTVSANLALGYTFQRAYAPVTPPYQIANYLSQQLAVDGWLGDGRLNDVRRGDVLPARGDYGDIFIVGDCDAVYWSDGMVTNAVKLSNWNGVERADARGAAEAEVTFDQPSGAIVMPVFTTNPGPAASVGVTVFVIVDPSKGIVQFGSTGDDGGWLGSELTVAYETPMRLRAVVDPRVHILEVYLDERLVLAAGYDAGMEVTFGKNTYNDGLVAERFRGTIVPRGVDMSLCDRLLDSVGS